jgi:hypothetical protein
MWARCWQPSDPGARFPSPRVDWPQIGGRESLRRAGTAETGDGGRDCSGSGEDRDGAEPRVARLASLRPSGGPGRVGWPGEQVGSGTRQRRPLGPVFRRAGGMDKATRWRASSLGVGRSFRRAQMATGTSGARY